MLSDFLQDYRRLAIDKGYGQGQGHHRDFKKDIKDDANTQPHTKLYN